MMSSVNGTFDGVITRGKTVQKRMADELGLLLHGIQNLLLMCRKTT